MNNQPAQAICDHIKKHDGNSDLFFDAANLQTLCKRCHDSSKQSEERRGYSDRIGEDGWPVDPDHPINLL
jgi:5-methylcytosine-specific restriction protein A